MTAKDKFNALAAKVKRNKKKVLAGVLSVPLFFGVPRTASTAWELAANAGSFAWHVGKDLTVDGAYGMYQHSTYEQIHYRGLDGKECELKVLKGAHPKLEDAMDKFPGKQDDITRIFTDAGKIDSDEKRIEFLLMRLQKPDAKNVYYFTDK
jgi:hypothetical protein